MQPNYKGERASRALREDKVDGLPILHGGTTGGGPGRSVGDTVGHLGRPVARVVAIVEIAFDRLAEAVGAVAGVHFPARREHRGAAIGILGRWRVLRQRTCRTAASEHHGGELPGLLVAGDDARLLASRFLLEFRLIGNWIVL